MTARTAINSTVLFSLAVVAMALAYSGSTYAGDAAPANWLSGAWAGRVRTDKGTYYVAKLTVDPANPGKNMADFGATAYCAILLSGPEQNGDTATLRVRGSTGGVCDRYLDGSVQVRQLSGNTRISFTVSDRSNSSKLQSSVLSRIDGTAGAAPKPLKAGNKKPKAK